MQRMLPTSGSILSAVGILLVVLSTGARGSTIRAPLRDGEHITRKYVRSWQEIRRQNIVMQRRDYSCGAAALATVIRYYWGDDVGEELFLKELDKMLTPEEARDRVKNGLALTDLRRVAVKTGYRATMGKLTFEKLTKSRVPVVLGITVDGHDHFAVYRGTDGQRVYLADPIRGNIRVPTETFLRQWQKNAVLVIAKPGAKVRDVSPLSVRQDEICLGQLNWQYVRRQALRLPYHLPLPIRP